jgi:vacuolar protein sorting-associated protein IST1
VDAYLNEIAKAYGVKWVPAVPTNDETVNKLNNEEVAGDGGVQVRHLHLPGFCSPLSPHHKYTPQESTTSSESAPVSKPLEEKTSSIVEGRKTPKLPDIPPTEDSEKDKENATPPKPAPTRPQDDFDALAKRFEALKKR